MIREEEIIRDKLHFFKDNNIAVHLVLVGNTFIEKIFRNGKTKEFLDDKIIFNDEKMGEIPIFLREIISVDKRLPKEVER